MVCRENLWPPWTNTDSWRAFKTERPSLNLKTLNLHLKPQQPILLLHFLPRLPHFFQLSDDVHTLQFDLPLLKKYRKNHPCKSYPGEEGGYRAEAIAEFSHAMRGAEILGKTSWQEKPNQNNQG